MATKDFPTSPRFSILYHGMVCCTGMVFVTVGRACLGVQISIVVYRTYQIRSYRSIYVVWAVRLRVCFVCNSLMADGPQRPRLQSHLLQRRHPACGHYRFFPSLPGARLTNFIAMQV